MWSLPPSSGLKDWVGIRDVVGPSKGMAVQSVRRVLKRTTNSTELFREQTLERVGDGSFSRRAIYGP